MPQRSTTLGGGDGGGGLMRGDRQCTSDKQGNMQFCLNSNFRNIGCWLCVNFTSP